jgi:hypothetical protein
MVEFQAKIAQLLYPQRVLSGTCGEDKPGTPSWILVAHAQSCSMPATECGG